MSVLSVFTILGTLFHANPASTYLPGRLPERFGDSIRSEVFKNQRVVIYRVSAKETWYSVARKYGIKPAGLISFNDAKPALKVGDEIRIPRGQAPNASSTDSPGTHQVQKGETLYSISRKYQMTVDALVQMNSLDTREVKLGQILRVKSPGSSAPEASSPGPVSEPAEKTSEIPATGLYVVQAHETLYAISQRYNLSPKTVKDLNNLNDETIHPGQVLKLRSSAGEPASRAPSDQKKKTAGDSVISDAPPKPGAGGASHRADSAAQPRVAPKAGVIFTPESSSNAAGEKHVAREFREEGMGTWLNNTDLNQARSVGLHHSAPVGTILKVTNPATRKSIFVKVVGNFQENADNKNAIVMISKSAADLIGAVNQNFRVELSYAY